MKLYLLALPRIYYQFIIYYLNSCIYYLVFNYYFQPLISHLCSCFQFLLHIIWTSFHTLFSLSVYPYYLLIYYSSLLLDHVLILPCHQYHHLTYFVPSSFSIIISDHKYHKVHLPSIHLLFMSNHWRILFLFHYAYTIILIYFIHMFIIIMIY